MTWLKASIERCAEWQQQRAFLRTGGAVCAVALAALAGCAGGPSTGGSSEAGSERASTPLPVWQKARSWEDYKRQAARRVLAANPKVTHDGAVEQPSLAIPVLKVVLAEDGSIRRIDVMRRPSQAQETTQVAIDAVRRAGPFGPVAHLPKPWEFSEAFLFNEDGRFKPMTLDR